MGERIEIIPRLDTICENVSGIFNKDARLDVQYAPLFAEKLRHTYAKVLEVPYPELIAVNGEVLAIDTEVDPADIVWEYYVVDKRGVAYWIDDDGQVMGNSAMTMRRKTGEMHEMGHAWQLNVFDLERWQKAGVLPLASTKVEIAKRAHDEKTQWAWLFGDQDKKLLGLCNHPNISTVLAPLNDGSASRLFANKTNDEITADIGLLINSIPEATKLRHFASVVYMSHAHWTELQSRRIDSVVGHQTLLDYLRQQFAGDESGQGKVEFKIMNECKADWRRNPANGTDDSGISGDFMIALPPTNKDVAAFVRARAFTQFPPQERDFNIHNLTHSKIGGCKLTEPLAVARLDFGLV